MFMPADNLEINETTAAQFAQLVLNCIEQEYPTVICIGLTATKI